MFTFVSYFLILVGVVFWFWGTSYLLKKRSVLYKIHGLSVSDTLGSMLIVLGLLVQVPAKWPLLILALISLAIWNTMLGYVLAYSTLKEGDRD
jgi:multicomponent Na+:H+ antiporter subunit G